MKLTSTNSVVDAVQHAANMDEQIWPQIVSKVNGIDVLHAGQSNPNLSIYGHQVRALIEFARRNYRIICADLSGHFERYSIEVMQESKKIFLVCTPEVAALHLAREKMEYLQSIDLGDRVSVLLNRHSKRAELGPAHVEELVGAPVEMTFPNDYARVTQAIREGKTVDTNSELGRQCAALAEKLGSRRPVPVEKKRRFVEYFALTPARYSFDGRQ
jgi:pilus assembly protein CpaE